MAGISHQLEMELSWESVYPEYTKPRAHLTDQAWWPKPITLALETERGKTRE